MNPITLNVTYTMKPGMRQQFLDRVSALHILEGVRSEPGCLQYAYFIPLDSPDQLFLLELWKDQDCLDAHTRSANMAKLKAVKDELVLDTNIKRFD